MKINKTSFSDVHADGNDLLVTYIQMRRYMVMQVKPFFHRSKFKVVACSQPQKKWTILNFFL